MPVYEFYCKPCNAIDEVRRPMSEATAEYKCPDCGTPTKRKYTAPNVQTPGEQIPYLHPAFGTVMTDKQAAAEAKRRGWVEVGTEDQHKHIGPTERQSYDAKDYFL